MTRIDKAIAALLFLGTLIGTAAVAQYQGVNRDEAYYMEAGEDYITYYERLITGQLRAPFSDATIGQYWGYNHEHPPLMKVLYGLSWRLFHTCRCAEDQALHPGPARLASGRHVTLPLFGLESTAFRLPTMVCFAFLTALIYLFFRRALGGMTGALAAALLTALQPRAFFHAQTAGFDLPAATLWIATTYAWWNALQSEKKRPGVAVGILWGLFLATKLQSFFLPIALGGHWLYLYVQARRGRGPRPTVWPMVWMALLGPLVFFLSWPWLWHDPFRRFGEYLGFHLHHVHYNFEYLGINYYHPPYPWHEPLGMLITTAPVVLLALAVAGAAVLVRSRHTLKPGLGALLGLAALVPVAVFFRGTTPIFGETKHWLATMPVLALSAGAALEALWHGLGRSRLMAAALVAVAVAPAAVETARSHPYGLSHYNALAGGAPGGADLGMNRQFWGYSVLGVIDWLNANLPADAKLYLHDWNHDAYDIYRRERRLRFDIGDAGMEDPGVRASTAALVVHEKHFAKYEYMIWSSYGTVQPALVLTLDGVPLVTVYRRPSIAGK